LSAIRFHLDEHADAHALLDALRRRGVDVTSSRERGILGRPDEEQLSWATEKGPVIYTYNAADFCRLHSAYLKEGRRHTGIIIGDQQSVSIGEEMRQLLKLGDTKTAEAMESQLEFLSNWT